MKAIVCDKCKKIITDEKEIEIGKLGRYGEKCFCKTCRKNSLNGYGISR